MIAARTGRSPVAAGRPRLAALWVALALLAACSDSDGGRTSSPTSPVLQRALQILGPNDLSVPADGVSTVRIEAQIRLDATSSRRIRFHTTLGDWVESGSPAGAGKAAAATPSPVAVSTVTRTVDGTGKAAAFLRSANIEGVAEVTVSAIASDDSVVAFETRNVRFTGVNRALRTFTARPDSALVDDPSPIILRARISGNSPSSWDTVIFTTTRGGLNNSAAEGTERSPVQIEVRTEGTDRIARAELRSKTAGSATVTATIKGFEEAMLTRFVTFRAREGGISASPRRLAFGNVAVGSSAERVLTVENTGTGDLEVISVTSSNSAFTPVPRQQFFDILPGDSRPVTVRFTATGDVEDGTLTLSYRDPAEKILQVPMTGASSAPAIAVEPNELEFGSVPAGTTAKRVLTVLNTGGEELVVSLAAVTNSLFTVSPEPSTTAPLRIAPGGTAPLTVSFSPTSETTTAAQSDVLRISSNDPRSRVVAVSLSGRRSTPGTPVISVSPAHLAFGVVAKDATSAMVLTIANTGTATLHVIQWTITNDLFTVTAPTLPAADSPTPVQPGGTLALTVQFAPDVEGVQTGVLSITSDDPLAQVVAVPLSGETPTPDLALDQQSLAFGGVTSGSTKDLVLTISNVGSATLTVKSVTSTKDPPFKIINPPAADTEVPPGGTLPVTVRFSPTSLGDQSGVLNISSDDPLEELVAVSLTGTGT